MKLLRYSQQQEWTVYLHCRDEETCQILDMLSQCGKIGERMLADLERVSSRSATNWPDVPARSVDECDAALSHATAASWLFYIPAYMKRALEQEQAVVAFLRHFRENGDHWHSQRASEALNSYWSVPPDKRQRSLVVIP